jgi:hypothetical protein
MRARGHRAVAVLCLVLALSATLPIPAHAKKSRLPKRFDRDVLCDACGATVVELDVTITKTEKKKGRGAAIADAMDAVCDDVYRFTAYDFPPPKIQKGCFAILEAFADEIETTFVKRVSVEDAKHGVCAEACEGVDQETKKKTSGTAVEETYVDGAPYDGTADGEL